MTGRADFWASGDWNAVCYECGRKRKASTLKRNWQGYYVCAEHWEPRQPQDFVRSVPDVITPPWAQPPSDVFKPWNYTPRFLENVNLRGGIAAYMETYADYFAEDYLVNVATPEISLIFDAQRLFNDSLFVEEELLNINFVKSLAEFVTVTETVAFMRKKDVTDTLSLSEAGSIWNLNYVDPTYFESDYVGELLITF